MSTILIVILILLILGALPAWNYGGPYMGWGLGLIVVILIILLLFGRI